MPRKRVNINKNQGIRLSHVRKEKRITQEMLAEKSNYSVQTISGIENGTRRMTLDSATIFSKILGVRKEYLLCEDDYETNAYVYKRKFEKDIDIEKAFNKLIALCGYIFNVNTSHFELNGNVISDSEFKSSPMPWEEGYLFGNDPIQVIDTWKFTTPQGEIIVSNDDYEKFQKNVSKIENEMLEFLEFKLQKLMKEGGKK